ncbi:YraN family protein [uncultured Bacteroides sp.]|uniref:YraN family protein n=1 Tax=uncultured Bacteroides sp. TaxID=162156 RepID=UPI002AAB707F|nr:YraN family protein [uncultured Bacteroides sp.]
MAEHNILGKDGEEEAVKHLISHNYTIRHRNWRRGRKELDIVAEKENELIIVEVKTRRNRLFAEPQDAVTPLKIRRTVLAADAYLKFFQIDLPVRFDIITVVGEVNSFSIEHIKEAFYPPVW